MRERIDVALQHLVEADFRVQLVLQDLDALLVLVPERLLPFDPGRLVAENVFHPPAAEQRLDRDAQPSGDQGNRLVEQAGPAALERDDGRPAHADIVCKLGLGEAGQLARLAKVNMEEVILHGSKLFVAGGIPVPEFRNHVQKN